MITEGVLDTPPLPPELSVPVVTVAPGNTDTRRALSSYAYLKIESEIDPDPSTPVVTA